MLKDFETLFLVTMAMADVALTNQTFEARISKLNEEYEELVAEYANIKSKMPGLDIAKNVPHPEHTKELKGEMADCLFVLLHMAHKLGFTAKDLLHMAGLKMFGRLNDPNYTAKEQRNG